MVIIERLSKIRFKLRKNTFLSDLSYTSGKNLIGTLIQIVAAPIIVRLYSPESYGTFGFVLSTTSLLLPLAALQYERAVYMTRSKEELDDLSRLLFLLPVILGVFVFIVLFILKDQLLATSNMTSLGYWILTTPLLMILTSWANTSQYLLAANYKYKQGFLTGIFPVITGKTIAIGHAKLISGIFSGLLLAELITKILTIWINLKVILKKQFSIHTILEINFKKLKQISQRYSNFPKIELPSMMINVISKQIPLFWIPKYFGTASFGHYALAVSLMESPMRLLGYSLSGVYFQRAVTAYRTGGIGSVRSVTLRSVAFLIATSFIPILIIGLFSYELFALIFGQDWALSGAIAQRLCIAYTVRIVVEPIGAVWRVLGEQKKYLIFNSLFLAMRATVMAVGIHLNVDLIAAVTMYAMAEALGYLAMGAAIAYRLWPRESASQKTGTLP